MTPIPTIKPHWTMPEHVHVHSTSRLGGVSKPPHDSLNLGLHVNDDEVAVMANRQQVRESLQLPAEPIWLNQVHGSNVVRLPLDSAATDGSSSSNTAVSICKTEPEVAAQLLTADGAWTNTPGVVLAVLTADCLPVVITDKEGTAIAVAHAGWRSLHGGVLEAVLAHFPENASLMAWLGPAIGPSKFEVGMDVHEAFIERDAYHAESFRETEAPGKFLADIYSLAARELARSRDVIITGGIHCTVSNSSLFHSYRRDGLASGRMATLAWLS